MRSGRWNREHGRWTEGVSRPRAGGPNSDNLAPNSSNHASYGVPKVVGRWATGTEVAANPGGCDAGANLKEGNHVKFVRAGNGDNECAGLADGRVAGFSPMSAPQTGLCRRSGERSSNTASERRAHSGRFGLARVVLESFSTFARMPRTRMGLFQTSLPMSLAPISTRGSNLRSNPRRRPS